MPRNFLYRTSVTSSEAVRDVVIGMSDGLTVQFARCQALRHRSVQLPDCGDRPRRGGGRRDGHGSLSAPYTALICCLSGAAAFLAARAIV